MADIADFHKRGVKGLFPMMMWDQGTRDNGKSWPDAIAELMAEIGADGINGDTSRPRFLWLPTRPVMFEPEHNPSDEALAWNVMTWVNISTDSLGRDIAGSNRGT